MVSPAPAPPEALPVAGWLARLIRILRIADQGVLVLVEGPPARLPELVRAVSLEEPRMEVLTRAPELAHLPAGSTVVLCLRPEDFDWLNGARPAVLGHRVVLFGDEGTVTALSQRAFDFFDWISHRVEAPGGPPAFAVRALASAMCARPRVLVWRGDGLDATFRAVRPAHDLARLPATLPYPDLVEGMRPALRRWVAVTDGGDPLSLRRARWAAAEAGRAGRTVLVDPVEVPAGAKVVSARMLPVDVAARMLGEAGVEHPARAAALLGLEAEAIERACRGHEGAARDGDDVPVASGEAWSSRLGPWGQVVSEALTAGDTIIATRWIARWQEAAPGDPYALLARAVTEVRQGRLDLAASTLEQARPVAPAADHFFRFFLLQTEMSLAAAGREEAKCAALAAEALHLGRALHLPAAELAAVHGQHIVSLANLGRITEAALSLRGARELPRDARVDTLLDEAEACLALRSGRAETALRILASRKNGAAEASPFLVALLSRALIQRGRFEDAERLTRTAIREAERRGDRAVHLRAEHASAMLELGRFDKAIVELRALLESDLPPADAAVLRTELGRCLTAQGQFAEAANVLDEALRYFEAAKDGNHAAHARAAGRATALELLAAAQMRLGHAHAEDTLRRAREARQSIS
jgi:tetratricopeptide (TPR) repeat protein